MSDGGGEYLELLDWRRRIAALFASWRQDAPADLDAATRAFRAARDELFGSHPQSPIAPADRASFGGLAYWPYDAAYHLTARLETDPSTSGPHADAGDKADDMPWSGASAISLRRVGWLTLSGPLDGHRLSAYWVDGYAGGLFVPFRDATSGSATYGAGRYLLDTIKSADHGVSPSDPKALVLDFNLSFHPSCAYDPRWACPLAPPENRLTIPVEVGERLPR